MINIYYSKLKLVKEQGKLYDIPRKITSPHDVFEYATKVFEMQEEPFEVVCMLLLDTKLNVIGVHEVSRGSIDASILQPAEVFKIALLHNAARFILVHNHPSGVASPSTDDIAVTKTIVELGKKMGIPCDDHIVIGENTFTSLRQESLI